MKNNNHIRENSWIAKIAAKVLKSKQMAVVFRRTIYLYKVSETDFLADKRWLNHELCHIGQYKKYGTVSFIMKYLLESIRHGYNNNRFEKEAREAESVTLQPNQYPQN